MSARRSSTSTPPPALQPIVLTRIPLTARPIRRINDTPLRLLSTPHRPNIAAHRTNVAESTGPLSAVPRIAIAQIPIPHRLD